MLRIFPAIGLGEARFPLRLVAASSAREAQTGDHEGAEDSWIVDGREGRVRLTADRIDLTGLPTKTTREQQAGDSHSPLLELTARTHANLRWTDGPAGI